MVLRGSRLGEDDLTLRDGLLALFQCCGGLRQLSLGGCVNAAQQRVRTVGL